MSPEDRGAGAVDADAAGVGEPDAQAGGASGEVFGGELEVEALPGAGGRCGFDVPPVHERSVARARSGAHQVQVAPPM